MDIIAASPVSPHRLGQQQTSLGAASGFGGYGGFDDVMDVDMQQDLNPVDEPERDLSEGSDEDEEYDSDLSDEDDWLYQSRGGRRRSENHHTQKKKKKKKKKRQNKSKQINFSTHFPTFFAGFRSRRGPRRVAAPGADWRHQSLGIPPPNMPAPGSPPYNAGLPVEFDAPANQFASMHL